MKFLVDNQLPKALARWLTEHGCDAQHVLDRNQGQTDDRTIWEDALAESRIIASKDEDFFILATRPGDEGKLLWLRVGNCRTYPLLELMERMLPEIEKAFRSGQRIVEIR